MQLDLVPAHLSERFSSVLRSHTLGNAAEFSFNLCIVSFNEHDRLYDDVTKSLYASLGDLGYACSITENAIAPGRVNIVLGNLVHPAQDAARMAFLAETPFLIYQAEPLSVLETLPVAAGYFQLLDRAAHVIDYSPSGFAYLNDRRWSGKASLLAPSFHRCLEFTRPHPSRDIDVLFYGSHSERRGRVMDDLRARGLEAVHLFSAYGDVLWDHIRRARIVLNMHYRDGFDVLETVRLVPLLANRCFVVSERGDHNPFGDGIVFADHEDLADTCVAYIRERASERETVASEGYLAVRRLDMVSRLEQVLAALDLGALVADGRRELTETDGPSSLGGPEGARQPRDHMAVDVAGVSRASDRDMIYAKPFQAGQPHSGVDYLTAMRAIGDTRKPASYVEIGTRHGDSLLSVDADALCIDPQFEVSRNVIKGRRRAFFFQMTSDDFFRDNRLDAFFPTGVDLAYLDGLHHFETTLRDFINIEKQAHRRTVVLIHDCLPTTLAMAARAVQWGDWTGDIWRLLPIFKKYRPDLRLLSLDCPPTGLVVCTRLDPTSTVLSDRYYDIVDEFSGLPLDMARLAEVGTLYPYLDSTGLSANPADLACVIG